LNFQFRSTVRSHHAQNSAAQRLAYVWQTQTITEPEVIVMIFKMRFNIDHYKWGGICN